MARLIGTAGHVDHGKTSLIQALTGIDADRLPEEKRRGLTIDIGFAHIELPGVGKVSIVDVPGHEKFLTNMLVGAMGIDVALLCVAADESVMPQTREHFHIIELLPVDRMLVALTKSDLADSDLKAMARLEVEELLARSRFAGSPIIEVSSKTGEGIEQLRVELSRLLAGSAEESSGSWYLPIDRVFTVKGYGTVVTGTLAAGRVEMGDSAVVEPGGLDVRVRGIQWHDESQSYAVRGRRTALNLAGIKLEDLARGQAVGSPGTLFETRVLDARMNWVVGPKHAMRVRLSIGAAEAIGKLFLNSEDPTLAQLRLEQPVAAALNQPIVVRRYSPPDVIGGGRVLVPIALPRRRTEVVVQTNAAGTDEDRIVELVSSAGYGLETEEISRRLGKSPQTLGQSFENLKHQGKLLGFAGLWMTPSTFASCRDQLIGAIRKVHQSYPTRAFVPRAQAISAAQLPLTGKPLDRFISALLESGALRSNGADIALPDFRVELNERQKTLLGRVRAELDRAWPNEPSARELAAALHVPPQAIDEILKVGFEAHQLVRVAEEIFYTPEGVERLKDAARKAAQNGPFSASTFRDAIGTSRRFAIPILEYLDSIRFTIRVGDERSIVS